MASNPFNFSEWLRHETSNYGGDTTGDDVELGRSNVPDRREGTIIHGYTPNNAALAGIYRYEPEDAVDAYPTEPGVGVYGTRSA